MIDRLLFAFIFLSLVSPAYGDYFDGFKCHQELPASQDMKLEYMDKAMAFKWYKIEHATAKFGNIKSDVVNYVFLGDKFYGKVCAIIGKDNINEILRYFKKEVERINDQQPENQVFKEPTRGKDGSIIFIEPDKIIVVKRFSVHLGQVEILCRDMFEKYIGIPEEGKK